MIFAFVHLEYRRKIKGQNGLIKSLCSSQLLREEKLPNLKNIPVFLKKNFDKKNDKLSKNAINYSIAYSAIKYLLVQFHIFTIHNLKPTMFLSQLLVNLQGSSQSFSKTL